MRSTSAVLALVLAGCSQPAPDPPPAPPIDEAAVNQAVGDLWNRLVVADTSGNVDAFLAEFHNDIRLDVPGMPAIIGRAAFEALARPMFAARKATSFAVTPFATTVVSNDLALQGGSFVETFVEQRTTKTEYGRYATSVARGTDGQWKIVYWMSIADSIVPAR